jgi:hypothetical protein
MESYRAGFRIALLRFAKLADRCIMNEIKMPKDW